MRDEPADSQHFPSVFLHQHVSRDTQGLAQLSDHLQGQLSFAIQYLTYPALEADYFRKVLLLHAQLFHSEFDRFNGIRHSYRKVFVLIIVDEYAKDLQFIAFLAPELRIKNLLKSLECVLIVLLVPDRCDGHVRFYLRQSCRSQRASR